MDLSDCIQRDVDMVKCYDEICFLFALGDEVGITPFWGFSRITSIAFLRNLNILLIAARQATADKIARIAGINDAGM